MIHPDAATLFELNMRCPLPICGKQASQTRTFRSTARAAERVLDQDAGGLREGGPRLAEEHVAL